MPATISATSALMAAATFSCELPEPLAAEAAATAANTAAPPSPIFFEANIQHPPGPILRLFLRTRTRGRTRQSLSVLPLAPFRSDAREVLTEQQRLKVDALLDTLLD